MIKSWDEFYYRKRARGRATGATKQRDEAFFKVHDRNEVVDPMPAWLVAAAEEESRRIEARLRAGPSSGARSPSARSPPGRRSSPACSGRRRDQGRGQVRRGPSATPP